MNNRANIQSVLSSRAIGVCAVLVLMIAGFGGWLLLDLYGGGTAADQAKLEAIRTVGAVVLSAGGALALLLAARRQQTAERDLIEKRRDLAHREHAQQHAEKIAADNHAHLRRVSEVTERDAIERRITDLYSRAAEQLGSDKAPVRLAGLYALERLAQDNPIQRLTITNVICAYLRMPCTLPGDPPNHQADKETRAEHRGLVEELEVRLTAQRIISQHFIPQRVRRNIYWGDLDLDLTGATLIEFNLAGSHVGNASFSQAQFVGDAAFDQAIFAGDTDFDRANFTGETSFSGAGFTGITTFDHARFSGAAVFEEAHFKGSTYFTSVRFAGDADFYAAHFVNAFFDHTEFRGAANFELAQFAGLARFDEAVFHGNLVHNSMRFAFGTPPEMVTDVSGGR